MVKVGDKVKFLNDVGGGIVTKIINKNTVAVENEDGFEIPTLISQLVLVGFPKQEVSQSSPLDKQKDIAPQRSNANRQFLVTDVNKPAFYLAFVPDNRQNPVGAEIKAYLVNDSVYNALFHFSHEKEGKYFSVESGELAKGSSLLLEVITQDSLNELPGYAFQLIYYPNESASLFHPITKVLNINPVKFYKESSFMQVPYFYNPAMLYSISENILEAELGRLTDDDFRKVVREKELKLKKGAGQTTRAKTNELVEVDLHIHELIDDTSGLSKREILEIQMDKFSSEMEAAIKSKAHKIVFIHGVGQGTLKAEVHKTLKSKYKKYYFQDASFKEYGYGATMVVLRKG